MGNSLGMVMEAKSIAQQTGAEKAQASFNKQIALHNAKLSRDKGDEQARDIRRQAKRNVATAKSISVASGVVSTSGSALLAQTQIAFEAEKQALTANRASELQAAGFESEASFRDFESRLADIRGKHRRQSSMLSGIAGSVSDMSSFNSTQSSDKRLKTDIKLVGKSPKGINIYQFRYNKGSNSKHVFEGVIAQELMEGNQGALRVDQDGFLMVDYSHIDVDFKQIK